MTANILLIGNGFDLAHDLPTSYKDFLDFCDVFCEAYCEKSLNEAIVRKFSLNGYIQENLLQNTSSNEKNRIYEELKALITENGWIKYFRQCRIGKNWIDFEAEISRIVQILDDIRTNALLTEPRRDWDLFARLYYNNEIFFGSFGFTYYGIEHFDEIDQDDLGDVLGRFDNKIKTIYQQLEQLIRALEIYIAEFVNKIPVPHINPDIDRIKPDCILSFNYSNTYERVYDRNKRVTYDFIHGKAEPGHTIDSCNLVLGIDEYLNDSRKDTDLEFLPFKKYYQRIYKSTGNKYVEWINRIRDGKIYFEHTNAVKFDRIVLSVFGHSLNVTDGDILRRFLCNDDVAVEIYYYRKSEDDRSELGKQIHNLVKIMGQDELIRRTGNNGIRFIPQTMPEKSKPEPAAAGV